eukprot:TRINITY_DN8422_c0_g1_i13.p1 TRINITY_DN8422_c0_g1~~TRINITY_DN8422_c0_g1_i13.p1  ORF type:complete len:280 (+),score=26.22 TRINITY_DN8422_c0_g1_i13:124-963(+)
MRLLNSKERHYRCKEDTMCSRLCQSELSPGDALEFLTEKEYPKEIRTFAVNRLKEASIEELHCYLPLLIHNIRNEPDALNSALFKLLTTVSPKHPRFCCDLYWGLIVATESQQPTAKSTYDSLKAKFCVDMGRATEKTLADDIPTGQTMVNMLAIFTPRGHRASENEDKHAYAALDRAMNGPLDGKREIGLPLDPLVRVTKFDVYNLKVMKSAMKPVIIPCVARLASIPERSNSTLFETPPAKLQPHSTLTTIQPRPVFEIGRAVQQECRDRSRMPSSA